MRQTFRTILSTLLFATVAAGPAAAQSDRWEVSLTPYLMGASMSGTSGIRGREAEVDIPASDILSNLEFGAMGILTARKGNWGFGGDALWMALGATTDRPDADVDVNQGGFAGYGIRRLGAGADLTFGARVNTIQSEISFKGPLGVVVEQNKTWVDPLAGLILHTAPGRRVGFKVYTEVGGFGVGSKFIWQIFPTVNIGLGKSASLDLGYRWLDMNYEDGDGNERFVYDMLTQGPVMGLTVRF